jgi:hypothetical protein
MKYLPKFKWDHLTEEIAYEKVCGVVCFGGGGGVSYCTYKCNHCMFPCRICRVDAIKGLTFFRSCFGSSACDGTYFKVPSLSFTLTLLWLMVMYLQAVREQRMAQELTAAKRERDFYLSRVDRAKAMDAIQQRRQKKQQQDGTAAGAVGTAPGGAAAAGGGVGDGKAAAAAGAAAGGDGKGGGMKRAYGQRKVKADPAQPGAAGISDDVLGLLVAPKKKQRSS